MVKKKVSEIHVRRVLIYVKQFQRKWHVGQLQCNPCGVKGKKKVIAFGNPLLDTIIHVNDTSLLDKYDIPNNSQKELPLEVINSLINELKETDKTVTLGGCSQNVLRVFNWIMEGNCETIIFGAVGKDEVGERIKELIIKDGVQTRYVVNETEVSGRTVGIVLGSDRSLVAYVGAAVFLSLKDLLAIKDLTTSIKSATYVYIEGFFLPNRIETTQYILQLCEDNKKTVVVNTNGEYLSTLVPNEWVNLVTRADIVIGNALEFIAVGKVIGIDSKEELATHLVKNGKGKICGYGTIVIITDGPKKVKCFYGNSERYEFRECDVHQIPVEEFVDTIGAGDAFAAGFLGGLCKAKPLMECLEIGCYAAGNIIRQIGCSIPKYPPDPKVCR